MVVAVPIVVSLVAVVLAIVAVLLAYGAAQFGRLYLRPLLSRAPVIGGWIADQFESAMAAIAGTIESVALAAVGPVFDVILALVALPSHIYSSVYDALSSSISYTRWVAEVHVWRVAQQALSASEDIANNVGARVMSWTGDQLQLYARYAHEYTDYIVGIVIDQTTAAANGLHRRVDELTGFVQQVTQWAGQAIDELRGWASGEIERVERNTDTLVGGIAGNVEALARDIPAWTEQRVRDAVGHVEAEFTAADAATAATAAAATAVVATTLTDYLNRCGNKLCDYNSPITDGLDAILELLETGALLAFIASAIHDPDGAAETGAEIFAAPIDEALSTLRAL